MTEKQLLELKQEITETESEVTKLETRKELLMEKLEKDHGVKTLGAAEQKIKKMEKNIEKLDTEIDDATESLEAQLNEAS